jgi:outer membrane protein assembly factor BamB
MRKRYFLWTGLVGLAAFLALLPGSTSWLLDALRQNGNPAGGAASDPGARGRTPSRVWTFEPVERGAIVSSPLVAGGHVYVSVIHDAPLSASGAVYCLDRRTGKPLWRFDDDGRMLQVFSSPCLADGLLYVGEGMHQNRQCKLYCLEAKSGHKRWHFETADHIESSPCVSDGRVFFGAGDDGVYCLDAATGAERWHFQESVHVDTSPAVAGIRLYAGSGLSRTRKATEIFCLDTRDGRVLWRAPTDLPVWGSPALDGDSVLFGLGNGRLLEGPPPPAKPAGAVLCVDAVSGRQRWRWRETDAVFCRPVVDGRFVYFGARDGCCYCLDRRGRRLAWKVDLGGPVIGRPAVSGRQLYALTAGGRAYRLDAGSGRVEWSWDLAGDAQVRPQVFSSPTVTRDGAAGKGRRIYFGAELASPVSSAAVLYCLQD